jgi:hypothetical protein
LRHRNLCQALARWDGGVKESCRAGCRAFSCLLCCFEFQLKQVAKHIAANFGFLYEVKSRAIFLVL